jgi:hypothetical protein
MSYDWSWPEGDWRVSDDGDAEADIRLRWTW